MESATRIGLAKILLQNLRREGDRLNSIHSHFFFILSINPINKIFTLV